VGLHLLVAVFGILIALLVDRRRGRTAAPTGPGRALEAERRAARDPKRQAPAGRARPG
jgi:hypothetical protein